MTDVSIVRLLDYRKPDYSVIHHEMRFEIYDDYTLVHDEQQIRRLSDYSSKDLVLDGEALELISVQVNNHEPKHGYAYENNKLIIFNAPMVLTLTTTVKIYPQNNTQLSGLYVSNDTYCTQCEAEGFRRISFSIDRPDVLSTYRVRIEADKDRYPVLLSNGNPEEEGELGKGRHFVLWRDPFPKPTYLFALVAGKLKYIEDEWITAEDKKVRLRVYTREDDIEQAHFAMYSLKEAMRWDEERFGFCCDLSSYNIVAIGDFNMGAMENKGLNIFNTQYVLADTKTATDLDHQQVLAVIGHEYFHNWTGNRITCRDWFQLSLKEGLTVFREQEFARAMGDANVLRLEQADYLRRFQFAEDAGLTAHPVRPEAYAQIDNFYTTTVYEKGAEIIRMMHTLIGEEMFQQGMRLYRKRYDGDSATIEDFARCMQDASGFDFTGAFFRWYTTKHTPEINLSLCYRQESAELQVEIRQNTAAVSPESVLVIPLRFGLLKPDGEAYVFPDGKHETLLVLDEACKTYNFTNACADMVPVLLHDFSAPVRCLYDYDERALMLLARYADNIFVRHEALQRLYARLIDTAYADRTSSLKTLLEQVASLQQSIIEDEGLSHAVRALLLRWPHVSVFIQMKKGKLNLDPILKAHKRIKKMLALKLQRSLMQVLDTLSPSSADYSVSDAGIRQLQEVILDYYSVYHDEGMRSILFARYQQASSMTESLAALRALNHYHDDFRRQALHDFLERFRDKPLIVDKWFALQACYDKSDALQHIETLLQHDLFNLSNPNRVRALISAFVHNNLAVFHQADGGGYRLVCGVIAELSPQNPQLAARFLSVFSCKNRLDDERKKRVEEALSVFTGDEQPTDIKEILAKICQDE